MEEWLRGRPDAPTPTVRTAAGALAGIIVWLWLGGLPGLGIGSAAFVVVHVGLGRTQSASAKRKLKLLAGQADEVLDLLAAALQAGAPLRNAVAAVGLVVEEPSAELLSRLDGQVRLGATDAEAWGSLVGHPVWGRFAQDLARCADTGAGLAELLTTHAADARRDRAADLERRARAVGVRSVLPMMACFLPAFILVGVVPIVAGALGNVLHG